MTASAEIGRLFNLKPVLEMRQGETAVVARIRAEVAALADRIRAEQRLHRATVVGNLCNASP